MDKVSAANVVTFTLTFYSSNNLAECGVFIWQIDTSDITLQRSLIVQPLRICTLNGTHNKAGHPNCTDELIKMCTPSRNMIAAEVISKCLVRDKWRSPVFSSPLRSLLTTPLLSWTTFVQLLSVLALLFIFCTSWRSLYRIEMEESLFVASQTPSI
jgi:hypothetical protein